MAKRSQAGQNKKKAAPKQRESTKTKRRRIDWPTISREYIQGSITNGRIRFTTHQELADKYGVTRSAIEKRAMNEDWTQKRQEFLKVIDERTRDQVALKLAEQYGETEVDELLKIYRSFRTISDFAMNKLQTVDDSGKPTGQPNYGLTPGQVKDIAYTVRACSEQLHLIRGRATSRSEIDVNEDLSLLEAELKKQFDEGNITEKELREVLGDDANAIIES